MESSQFFKRLIAEGACSSEQLSKGVLARNFAGDTPIHCAVLYQQLAEVQALIRAGAPLEAVGEFGFTPLHCAAYRGYVEIVRILLSAGSNPRALSDFGETPVQLAASRGHAQAVAVLSGSA